jgi:beta-glucanase (GH16 family)
MFLPVLFLFFGCSKSDPNPGPGNTAPTNLTLTAVVSTDNSGNVSFTASANNATTYEYNYGNGATQIVTSGAVVYKYPASGSYTVTVSARGSSGQTISKSTQITVTVTQSLLWSEEFNTNGAPDATKWSYEVGAGGWGNAELQNYTNRPENSIVQGGVLQIKAIKESFAGSPWTSARLVSRNKFEFKYGRVDVSAKVPAGVGTWPAIWMLGDDISTAGWPACGEIDIMEHLGRDLNKIYATLHYPGRSGGNADGATRVISNATTEFHKYTLDWSAVSIKIYVDDVLIHSVANTNALPFNHEFFFILNIAMGGNFGGAIDPALTGATMEIDYIRVYQ